MRKSRKQKTRDAKHRRFMKKVEKKWSNEIRKQIDNEILWDLFDKAMT